MKLIIDIPAVTYEEVKWRGLYLCPRDSDALVKSIKNSKPYDDRPHGEWIYKGGKYWCSSCGEKAIYHSHVKEPLPHLTNFCPNCGASMVKEGESE